MLSLVICILLIIIFNMISITLSKFEESAKTKKLTSGINKLLLFVPIIVAIIFTILFLTVLKGRLSERTSHAIVVLSLWLYATSFYVNVLKYFKDRLVLFSNIMLMLVSVFFAIYLTPLNRYYEVMYSFTHNWAYLIGAMMLLSWYSILVRNIIYNKQSN